MKGISMGIALLVGGIILFVAGAMTIVRSRPLYRAASELISAAASGRPAIVAFNPKQDDFSMSSPQWPDQTIIVKPGEYFLLIYPR